MRKLSFTFCLLLMTTFCFASGGDKKTDNTNVISGKVLDAESGDELTGVRVELEGTDRITYTDKYGNFFFEDLQKDDFQLSFSFISFEELVLDDEDLSESTSSLPVIKLTSR